ncbi:MAG: hypothetical protein ACJ77Z_20515 [Thermoleophilaceae bacterium]
MRRSSALAVALAGTALAVAACGSGSGARSQARRVQPVATTAAQPAQAEGVTKADFIALADRTCRHTNKRLKPIISRLVRLDQSTQPLAFRLSGYRDGFHDLGVEYEDLVSELQQLDQPRRDHRMVTRTLRLLDAIPLHLDRLQASISSLDAESFIRAEIKLNQTFVRLGGTADAYGFNVCGVIPGRHRRGNDGPLPIAKNV